MQTKTERRTATSSMMEGPKLQKGKVEGSQKGYLFHICEMSGRI